MKSPIRMEIRPYDGRYLFRMEMDFREYLPNSRGLAYEWQSKDHKWDVERIKHGLLFFGETLEVVHTPLEKAEARIAELERELAELKREQ